MNYNKKNKEKLLRRREFFRRAIKETLPFVGLIVATPLFIGCSKGSAEEEVFGCEDCESVCYNGCNDGCDNSCSSA